MKVMLIFSFLASQINHKKIIWQLCFLFPPFKHIMCVTFGGWRFPNCHHQYFTNLNFLF
jgi:hypothetical protein